MGAPLSTAGSGRGDGPDARGCNNKKGSRMAGLARRLNGFLSSRIPEKRLFLQTSGGTSYIRLTPLTQLGLGTSLVALLGWTAVATAAVVLDLTESNPAAPASAVIHAAYQGRLGELAAERDTRAAEANSAQLRFQVATDQIGRQQSQLLAEVETQRELASALDLARARLREALAEKTPPAAETGREAAATPGARDEDLSQTLAAVSGALAATAQERDTATAEREKLARDLADAELRMTMASKRQDEMVEQLEQAVSISLEPLQAMLDKTDLNVDGLLNSVRRSYSGMGGPLGPVTVSSRSFEDPETARRFDSVMTSLDRVNLMRLAVNQVPLAMPLGPDFRFTSGFGTRKDPKGMGYRMHAGLDFASQTGTPIYATADGVVEVARRENGFGNVIRVNHASGIQTLYAHLNRIRVKTGQQLSRGDRIGDMGSTGRSTGTHLHYEVRVDGKPVNPMQYLEASKNVLEAPSDRTAAAD